jgi:simple sugar transport system permease protein
VALTACICSKINVFNIGLEGTMLTGAFVGIATNYYTHNVWLAVLMAGLSGSLVSFVVTLLIVEFKASPLIVGISVNTLMSGTTTFLMTVVFGSKGVFYDSSLPGMPKLNLPGIRDVPILQTMFSNLTHLDYGAFVLAILVFIYMYKTVNGFHLRAIGINKEAALSLGTKVDRFQITAVTVAGFFAGMGGTALTLGSVVVFTRGISSGRGYIALAANNLGMSHPLGVVAACAIFGFSEALGNVLQNSSIKSQILSTIPYIATIISLVFMYLYNISKDARAKAKQLNSGK